MNKFLLSGFVVFTAFVFVGRLSYMQLFNVTTAKLLSDPAIKAVYEYPERGAILDRNGKLLVANQPAYDVMVIPNEVEDINKQEFSKLLSISPSDFEKRLKRAKHYSRNLPSVFVAQLSKEKYATLQEKMRKYKGFYIQKRSLREYHTHAAANVLGYIGEVNTTDLKNNPYYRAGELKGRTGVERQYEDILRGIKGVRYIQKDRFNRDIGSYKDGKLDTLAKSGNEIQITIDKILQEYGEQLMVGKRGGIVAIEPNSGEILAMISGPTFDPALLVGRNRSANYSKLHFDSISKPTWDRSILAQPSPGSPFKTLTALAALQEGAITPEGKVTCYNGFYVGKHKRGCHCGGGIRDLNKGISLSCNAYFADTFKKFFNQFETTDQGMDVWEKHMKSFGLGQFLGTDIPTGLPGRIPDKSMYDRAYGDGRWGPTYIISNAIGQGEIATTPLQLANLMAAIANRGYFYTPHIIKKMGHDIEIDPKLTEKRYTTIDPKHFEVVIDGMANVYEYGTARWLKIPEITIAGKTGTVENFTKIDGKKVQLTDHSVFTAFAPVDNPKIAIAVYIEHGYFGARFAGHIASLMIEKYIKGNITRTDLEQRMLTTTLEKEYEKPHSGKPFRINEKIW